MSNTAPSVGRPEPFVGQLEPFVGQLEPLVGGRSLFIGRWGSPPLQQRLTPLHLPNGWFLPPTSVPAPNGWFLPPNQWFLPPTDGSATGLVEVLQSHAPLGDEPSAAVGDVDLPELLGAPAWIGVAWPITSPSLTALRKSVELLTPTTRGGSPWSCSHCAADMLARLSTSAQWTPPCTIPNGWWCSGVTVNDAGIRPR